ncbi:hypothetical protein IKU74_00305 [bacterium]|nr:hypothetical protein [bacterium]
MIYNKLLAVLSLVLLMIFVQYPPSYADSGYLSAEEKKIYLSTLDFDTVRKEADEYFVKAYEATTQKLQEKNFVYAMQKYYILTLLQPGDYYGYVQMARIHDIRKEDSLARMDFAFAYNLDKLNPYTNFYYGEFFTKRARYQKALKYYLTAYNNGYGENYVTIMKLAWLYEKLGDLKKSKEMYEKSYKINPYSDELGPKIRSLDAENYESTGYYQLIRE